MTRKTVAALLLATALTLASTFVGRHSAAATYADIMGCEAGCRMAASGWPFVFVRDYIGMSVVNRADILEVWFAADRFDWLPFLASWAVWGSACLGTLTALARRRRP